MFEKIQTPGVSNTLLEDQNGFIWVGTDLGLWRYDGYEFKSFTHIIPERIDAGMYQDADGYIWIGTGNGLIKFDPAAERRTTYRHKIDDSLSISNHIFQYKKYAFCEDSKGQLWIATDNGLDCYDKTTDKFCTYTNKNSGLIDNFITAILPSRDGLIWVATFKGLQKFDPEKKEVIHYYPGAPLNMYALCEDSGGDLWIGSYLDGLYRLEHQLYKFSEYKHYPDDKSSISSNTITYLMIPRNAPELLFIATFDGGLNILNINNGDLINYRDDSDCPVKKGLSGDSLAHIIQDKMGSFFILNEHGFLNRVDPETIRFTTLTTAKADSIDVPKASSYSVWADEKDIIWMIAGRNKISKYEESTDAFIFQYELSEDLNGLIAIDENSTIWLSGDGYIANVNPEDGIIKKIIPIDGLRLAGLNDNRNHDILWLGSTNAGLIKVDKEHQQVQYLELKHNNDTSDEGTQTRMKLVLAQDDDGSLWISSFGDGLQKFDTHKEELLESFNLTGLKTGNPSGFFRDSKQRCWVSFQNAGPALFDPDNGTFKYFEELSGQSWPARGSSVVIEDNNGALWISGNGSGELVKYEPENKKLRLYTQFDGVASGTSGTFGQKPVKGKDGAFWFAGMGGVTKFYPDAIKDNNYKPPVFISKLTQNGRSISFDMEYNSIPTLILEPGKNYFEFEAVSLNYRLSIHNQYKYRLIGRDNEWIEAGSRRNGFYSGIEEGLYRLEVMGSNNDGIWGEKAAELNIYVKPEMPDDFILITYSELENDEKKLLKYNENNFFIEAVPVDFSIINNHYYKYKLEGYDDDWIDIYNKRFVTYYKIPSGKYIFRVMKTDNEEEIEFMFKISPPFYKAWWFISILCLTIAFIIGLFWRQSIKYLHKEQEEFQRHKNEEKKLEKSKKEALNARISAVIERENAVAALLASEERNSELLSTMTEGFIITDSTWKITYANQRFYQMIGYGLQELVNIKIIDLIDDSFQEKLRNNLLKLKNGEKTTFEMRWLRKDGKKITTLISSSPLINKEGKYKESFAVITDISQLKETEETLLKSQKELIKEKTNLEEVNTTLKVLLKKRDDDIEEVKSSLQLNIKKLVVPYIDKMLITDLDETQQKLLDIVVSNLTEIAIELSQKLKLEYTDLTYSEIQVANLIREGLETKEIASTLNISMRTVEFHRANIRKKIGLKGKNINLRDHLMHLND